MNMKKVLAGALASVMAVSTMAVCASAADIAVDQSKLVWGDLEGNGNVRLEFYNVFGPTANNEKDKKFCEPSIDPASVTGGNLITVTLTIAGLPDNTEAKGKIGYGFSTTGKAAVVDIKGNGTYTFEYQGDNDVNGADWFSVDFAGLDSTSGLATILGISKEDVAKDLEGKEAFDAVVAAAKEKITISDVKISVTSGELSAPSTQEPAGDTTTAPVGDTNKPAGDKNQPNTGVEGVAVVAGLAVLAAGAIVIAKKRK